MSVTKEDLEAKLKRKNDKVLAFRLGQSATEDETPEDHFENMWMALPHALKVSTLFYDAKNHTCVLADFSTACTNFGSLNLTGLTGGGSGLPLQIWTPLNKLVCALNIELPDGHDFSPLAVIDKPPSQAGADAAGVPNKALFLKQRKAGEKFLVASTRLLDFLVELANTAIEAGKKLETKKVSAEYAALRVLINIGFFASVEGLLKGTCHVAIFKSLDQKMRLCYRDEG